MSNQERVAERRKHWGELIARQQQSGKTVKAFCEENGVSVSRYHVRLDRGHFSSGGSCHEEEESLVPSDVVDFSIVARQRVHYRAGPESCSAGSQGDELV